jgi:hypothetical protein
LHARRRAYVAASAAVARVARKIDRLRTAAGVRQPFPLERDLLRAPLGKRRDAQRPLAAADGARRKAHVDRATAAGASDVPHVREVDREIVHRSR